MSTAVESLLAAYPARYFGTWNGRDLDVVADLLAPSFRWADPSLPEPLTTVDDAHGFFTASWRGFPDIAFELIGGPLVDEAAGRVAQEWRMTGTHTGEGFPPGVAPTGNAFDLLGADVFSLDGDGRATEILAYYDAATLARQLGVA